MLELPRHRTAVLQQRMSERGIDLAALADGDAIACFGGFRGYPGVEYLTEFPRGLSMVNG